MPAEAISFEVFLPFVKNENVCSVSFADSLEDSVRARKMPKSFIRSKPMSRISRHHKCARYFQFWLDLRRIENQCCKSNEMILDILGVPEATDNTHVIMIQRPLSIKSK